MATNGWSNMVEEELLPPTAGDGRNLSATLRLDHGILEVYVSDLGFTRWHLLEFEELRQIIAGSFCGALSGCVWDCPRTKLPIAVLLTLLATHVEEAVGVYPASCYFDALPACSDPALEHVQWVLVAAVQSGPQMGKPHVAVLFLVAVHSRHQ